MCIGDELWQARTCALQHPVQGKVDTDCGKLVKLLVCLDNLRKGAVPAGPAIWLLDSDNVLGFHHRCAQPVRRAKEADETGVVLERVLSW